MLRKRAPRWGPCVALRDNVTSCGIMRIVALRLGACCRVVLIIIGVGVQFARGQCGGLRDNAESCGAERPGALLHRGADKHWRVGSTVRRHEGAVGGVLLSHGFLYWSSSSSLSSSSPPVTTIHENAQPAVTHNGGSGTLLALLGYSFLVVKHHTPQH